MPPDFAKYLIGCRRKSYSPGEPIFYQGEVPPLGMFVKSGVIKAYDIGNNGDEKTVALIGRNEFIPPAWFFGKSSASLYYYQAFTESVLISVQREAVRQLIETSNEFAKYMFDKYIGLFMGAVQHVNALEQSKSSAKIAFILQHLLTKFGKPIGNGNHLIPIRLTHQDIASMTGLTRETTSVELSRLKKRGIISYKDQHYVIATEKLQALFGLEDFYKL
ncbi:Crp/Fnr family transcriptional regulator [Candidatus Saccharibacteria bacterium]|jgi:CRP-like cAMP-binding protein|nr:Crp/Fnr family transcriptional regulator [Candidatus Saccharibacteria bacterium]